MTARKKKTPGKGGAKKLKLKKGGGQYIQLWAVRRQTVRRAPQPAQSVLCSSNEVKPGSAKDSAGSGLSRMIKISRSLAARPRRSK